MRRDAGLTLLELTLVVFILSVVALGAVSLVDRADDQVRYDDTRARLASIRHALVGERAAAFDGQCLLGGYVADVGALPADCESLVRKPSALDAYGLVDPRYGALALTGSDAVRLGKGWRGPYLELPPGGGAVRFRDGWGNVSPVDDALHHGWAAFDPAADPFLLTSFGKNGAPDVGGEPEYDRDVSLAVGSDDWRVELGGWAVDVRNATGGDLGLRVAVLVYAAGAWSHDNETAGAVVAAGATGTFTFGAGTVPLGRHLVLVVSDSADEPYGHPGSYVARRVSFFPRTQPATFALEVR